MSKMTVRSYAACSSGTGRRICIDIYNRGSAPTQFRLTDFEFRENLIAQATKRRGDMKTYRAFVTLPRIGQTPITIEARSTYEAKAKLEALYGKGNVTNPYEV